MPKIVFEKGKVVSFNDLTDNSVALDGYCQGPALDPEHRRFSFDHHAGCIRLVTKATCEQVWEAVILGLPIDGDTTILVNDIDADTVLGVWLLFNPDRVREEKVLDLVRRIGLTDAHGPVFEGHPLHPHLQPPYGRDAEPQSMEMLQKFLGLVTQYADGEFDPAARPVKEETSRGFGWSARTGWQPITTSTGFKGFYEAGFALGFLYSEAKGGGLTYTIAKASDLVACPLGPGSKVRPVTDVSQFERTVLGELGLAEQMKNSSQSLAHSWGGGTSIGGGPRNPDGSASCLTPDEVLAVFKRFVPDSPRTNGALTSRG